ncbi:MAG: hypothetical protein LBV69_08795 [Bacteroidales bacterium]|jgi:hypothetical protein|nr:hypothetical protein [Bacteroidales bacterium]
MKIKKIIFFIILGILIISCKTKDTCEINHTGNITIKNLNNNDIIVYVDGAKLGTVNPDKKIIFTKPVGTYLLKITSNLNVKEYQDVKVQECTDTDILADFNE